MRRYIEIVENAQSATDAFLAAFTDMTEPDPVDKPARRFGEATVFVSKSRYHPTTAILLDDIKTVDKRKGHGDAAMRMLCQLADQYGVSLELLAKAFEYGEGGMTTPELVRWYARYDFEPTGWTGQEGCTEMVRVPR